MVEGVDGVEAYLRSLLSGAAPGSRDAAPAPVPVLDERERAQRLLAEVVRAQRAVAAAEAATAEALASLVALYGGPGTGDEASDAEVVLGAVEEVAEEVAAALRWTPVAAADRVSRAVRLAEDLPMTLAALARGDLDLARVRVVVDGTAVLSAKGAATVDEQVCGPEGAAVGMTTGQLRAEVARRVHAVDAAATARRARRAVAQRRVTFTPLPGGEARLCAVGPATVLRETYDRLTADALAVERDRASTDPHADPSVDGEKDRRGLDAIRFDLLTTALPTPGSASGSANPGTTVLVALPTLLGADEEPVELSGYGPVPAWMARRAAADSRLRRVLTDPLTGQLVAIDGHTYPSGWLTPRGSSSSAGESGRSDRRAETVRASLRPDPAAAPTRACASSPSTHAPPALAPTPTPAAPPPTSAPSVAPPPGPPCAPVRVEDCPVQVAGGGPYEIPTHTARLVRARSPRCTAPGCRIPAARCDLDHVIRHPDGPTCPCNLTPLCRRHHRMKHRATSWRQWQVHRCEAGHTHWTSPLGHHHVVAPEPLLPPRDPSPGAPPREPFEPLRYPTDRPPGALEARSSPDVDAEEAAPPANPWAGMDSHAPPF